MVGNGLKGFYLDIHCTVQPFCTVVSAATTAICHLIGRTLGFHQQTPCTAC